MTKAEYNAKCSQRWDRIENLHNHGQFYDLEKDFDEIWTEMGHDVLESTVSKVPKDRRKKSLLKRDMEQLR